MRLHERTGRIVGVTRDGAQIVEFDHPEGFGGEPARCCQHPDCMALPARQEAVTYRIVQQPGAVEGARVRVWWERTAGGGGLVGEVIE